MVVLPTPLDPVIAAPPRGSSSVIRPEHALPEVLALIRNIFLSLEVILPRYFCFVILNMQSPFANEPQAFISRPNLMAQISVASSDIASPGNPRSTFLSMVTSRMPKRTASATNSQS